MWMWIGVGKYLWDHIKNEGHLFEKKITLLR